MSVALSSPRGFVLAVSAPSGTGKTSLCDKLAREYDYCRRSISMTTRPKREGEIDGKDYQFVSIAEFQKAQASGNLLETAEVFGNWYGTPRGPVEAAMEDGKIIIMDIDVIGALNMRTLYPQDSVLVFLAPPSVEALRDRLIRRGKNTPEELARRLAEAQRELEEAPKYDYFLINHDFDEAYACLKSITVAEHLRVSRKRTTLSL